MMSSFILAASFGGFGSVTNKWLASFWLIETVDDDTHKSAPALKSG